IKKGAGVGKIQLPQAQLVDWLRPKKMLLILDNMDHLIDETEFILELLEAAPDLKLLVTSRERLSLQQEQIFPVQGLAYPKSSETVDRKNYPAVDLFLEVAHRVKPEFELTAENLDDVIRLCRIVEGMPLSIELAAAWIDLLSPAEIAEEIKNSLDFLETNLRNFPERHRSIRAVFDASWEKLRSSDKKIFARLAIFQGQFSRRAARFVTGASLPVLGRLVDRSLIQYDSNREIYRINELLDQYGLDQLEQLESTEAREDLYERHSTYYLEAIHERADLIKGNGQIGAGLTVAGQRLTGQSLAGQKLALDEIGRDFKNIRYAWDWAVDHLKQDLILTGMGPLANFLEFRGRYHEGERIFVAFTDKLRKNERQSGAVENILLLCGYSWLCFFKLARDEVEAAQVALNKAATLVESLVDSDEDIDRELAFFYVLSGHIKAKQSLDDALPFYLQALELYRKRDMGWEQAAILTTMGSDARLRGDYTNASTWLDESLQIRQRIGDQIGAAETLASMSELSRYRGQCYDATIMAQSSVDLARQIDNDNVLAFGLVNLGMSYYYGGEFAKQHRCLIEALAIYESLHNTNRVPDVYYRLSLANASLGQYDASATNAQHGLNLARQTGNVVHMVNLMYVQAVAFLAAHSLDSGKQLLQHSLDIFPEIGQKTHRKCGIIMLIGYAEYNLGNPTPAKRHFYRALELAAEMEDQIAFILVFGISALVLADQDMKKEAVILWKMVLRFSPPFQKAAWLRAVYGDRLAKLEEELSSEEINEVDEHLQKNSMVDEA
ncbi:MAG: tetratricopeptide repeat protein, partial [Chloroflexota bacterium]